MTNTVPMIDLARARSSDTEFDAVARQIDEANQHVGFLAVVNHGVPQKLLDDMYDVTAEFFDLPMVERLSVLGSRHTSRGYIPPKQRALARTRGIETPADLVELFSIGLPEVPDDPWFRRAQDLGYFAANQWPEHPTRFREIWEAYYREMSALAFELMQLFAVALGLEKNWFDDKVDRPISNLFANHYPPLTAVPEPGQIRVGEHTDYGSLTLLYQSDAVGGLEVLLDDVWCPIEPIAGSFVVNIGDLMARWTNDRWISTLHRVQNPAISGPASRRISFPFFCQPNYDAVIETLPTCRQPGGTSRYSTITAGMNVSGKTDVSFDI
ncbi:isopenicillin N synthase family dioxygenase [Gordonia sputi]